jgi:hypothetical protein
MPWLLSARDGEGDVNVDILAFLSCLTAGLLVESAVLESSLANVQPCWV